MILSPLLGRGMTEFPGATITLGQISEMVAMRKSIAEGAARPAETAAFEATAAAREKALEEGPRWSGA